MELQTLRAGNDGAVNPWGDKGMGAGHGLTISLLNQSQ
jgi:hypothetical protein